MGIRRQGERILVAPFRPSRTLDNLIETGSAVVSVTDDVRVFAGCLTGRRDWPLAPSQRIAAPRLADCLAHWELELGEIREDPVRPQLLCRAVFEATHGPSLGFNRAQAAVLELAILVSRLDRLPGDKVAREIEYLGIAIEKTAGARELEAWGWLMERIAAQEAGASAETPVP
jgi:hypothetical protein